MKFQRLRVAGFKSFVEAADLIIEPGLTGIVGPNGCGKSNLVEALRWVMGEASSRNMRANGMDDVVFAGTAERPARNIAEVTLVLENQAGDVPSGFDDADVLEVSRRIERQAGSSYRINGREVRARDVQVLFADAATGARSPAMIRQGQIGELIAAKPQARRRVLEDAAGIAGLHARRYEAETRLKSADANLLRLDDVLGQIGAQADALKRQARHSARYRILSAELRRAQALVRLVAYREAEVQAIEAHRLHQLDVRSVADAARRQAEAARLHGLAAACVPALRDEESRAATTLQRLTLAHHALEAEELRIAQHVAALERRIEQLEQSLARERRFLADADASIGALEAEAVRLAREAAFTATVEAAAALRQTECEAAQARSEEVLETARASSAVATAQRQADERRAREASARAVRSDAELERTAVERCRLEAKIRTLANVDALGEQVDVARTRSEAAAAAVAAAEVAYAQACTAETTLRNSAQEAEGRAVRLETELLTVRRLLEQASVAATSLLNELTVRPGYEAALGAALGEDLEASLDITAAVHWETVPGDDPPLPSGVEPLASFVSAPGALRRRLAQIGVVAPGAAVAHRRKLAAGQRLVSREGDLWRWDGFTVTARAPTPTARRLIETNRLEELAHAAAEARGLAQVALERVRSAAAVAQDAAATMAVTRRRERDAATGLEAARTSLAAAERDRLHCNTRLAAIIEAQARLAAQAQEAARDGTAAAAALGLVADLTALHAGLAKARSEAAQDREAVAQARSAAQSLGREVDARRRRRAAVAIELQSWQGRRSDTQHEVMSLDASRKAAHDERESLRESPGRLIRERQALADATATTQAMVRQASDRHVEAATRLSLSDREARAALDLLSRSREGLARSEARSEAAEGRLLETIRLVEAEIGCGPSELPRHAGVTAGKELPPAAEAGRRLEDLHRDRERLGAVNLRADIELEEVERTRDGLAAERAELEEAVKKLRQAILNLNREGRERLAAAFDRVDGHFGALFTILFGGGSAKLRLVDSDDPLEAGLEIMVQPPGKALSTMSLLSGGEQALTAMALVFAVFLTHPAPICVLDEVDAPLDDANVERFCDLVDDMRRRTPTRFLVITHNPITMSRMDRLFGVTMAERGVSQLVSVDLATAIDFRETV